MKQKRDQFRDGNWLDFEGFSVRPYIKITSCKPVRCTEKLLKIKSKLILIHFTSFVERQDHLATNQFVTRLLQPSTW